MTALRQRMLDDMQLRNFSPCTQEAYVRAVEQFTRHFMLPPETLGIAHARQFLLHLVQEKRVAWSTYNVTRAGLIFFFQVTLGRSERIDGVPCARTRKRAPVVLSQEELQQFFSVISNKKHLAMFMTMYGAGLRVSELTSLRVEDIDSTRMLLRVQEGKGQKQRYTRRLNRGLGETLMPFGSPDYSREELVAEMGSAFLCAHAGISPSVIENQAAYISGWLGRLREDKKLVIQAAAAGQRAADWIRGQRTWDATEGPAASAQSESPETEQPQQL